MTTIAPAVPELQQPAAPTPLPPPLQRGFWSRQAIVHVLLVLLVGIVARVPFILAFRPIWSGDSPGYAAFYSCLTHHLFVDERTPVYPLFLGLAQWLAGVPPTTLLGLRACYAVILLQAVVGVFSAGVLYLTLRVLRIRPGISLGASLFFATIPALGMYEVNILNMALSSSLMVLAVALFLLTMKRLESGGEMAAVSVATGIALSLSVLNRPELLIFAILMGAVMSSAILRASARKTAFLPIAEGWKSLALIALPVTVSTLAWMLMMYIGIGQFRITTLDGWNRSRTVYNMFDRVDPEDRVIGGIMARTYEDEVARNVDVNRREIMWQASDQLSESFPLYPLHNTGDDPTFLDHAFIQKGRKVLGWVQLPCQVEMTTHCWERMRRKIDLGDYLGSVSLKLARKYPADWLHNVAASYFQESFNFRYADAKPAVEGFEATSGGGDGLVRNENLAALTTNAVRVEAPLLALLYCVTLGFFFYSPIALMRTPDEHWMRDMAVVALAVASMGTIVGTCVLAGFNRVYSLPYLAVFTIAAAYLWEHRSRIISAIRGHFGKAVAGRHR